MNLELYFILRSWRLQSISFDFEDTLKLSKHFNTEKKQAGRDWFQGPADKSKVMLKANNMKLLF